MDPTALLNMLAATRSGKMRPADVLQTIADESSDPTIARLVGTFLSEQADEEEDEDDDADDVAERRRHAGEIEKLTRILKEAQEEIERLAHELSSALQRNDDLAEATGACPQCWGENRTCDLCGGRGAPGSAPPTRESYQRYVAPVLRRRRAKIGPPPTNGGSAPQ